MMRRAERLGLRGGRSIMRSNLHPWLIRAALLSLATLALPLGQAQKRNSPESAVYVHDSGVAVEKLALAEKLERLKEWDRSADLYLEVARDFSDRVIAADGSDQRFVNIVGSVQAKLAKWPPEGVAAFRTRFEGTAAAALAAAAGHDPNALAQVLAQYFLTDAAKKAGLTLIDDELEAGEFSAATATARQLLDQHPVLNDDDRAQLLLRLGIAGRLAGNPKLASDTLEQLQQRFDQAIAPISGKDTLITDALDSVLNAPTTKPALPDDRWLMPLGNPSRDRIANRIQFGGTRMGYRDIDLTPPRGVMKNAIEGLQRQLETARQLGYTTGVFPAVDRGQLFYQDNARLYAIDLDSGEPLPGWAETYPQGGAYSLSDAWPLPQGLPCQLTLTDDSVLATMGVADFAAAQYVGITPHGTRLVCLDRDSGRARWTMLSQQLPDNLSGLDFAGCPLVLGDTVYVQAHGSHGSFDDAYLLAFDRGDGSFRWSCYLCSANLGSPDDAMANQSPVATTIAAESGQLFVQTNNGAVACVDPISGSAKWLSEYPRDSLLLDRNDAAAWVQRRTQMFGARRPWEHNSLIASGGKLFAMPDDASSLLIFDQTDGTLLRRVILSDYDGARTLLGVIDGDAVICSGKRLFRIDWTKYPANATGEIAAGADSPPTRAQEALVCASVEIKRPDAPVPEDAVRGRGVVSGDSVIIPTAWKLLRFSVAGGSLKTAFPVQPPQWADEEGPGNVLFAGDQMIIAGTTRGGVERISWYTDFETARRKLEAAEAASPRQIEPLLRSARALYTAGQPATAQNKLDAAIALTPSQTADARAKDRIYDAAIDLAKRAAADKHADPAVASSFFDRAAPYIAGPQQQVDYRIIRADFEKQRGDATAMITLYQQILAEPAWRAVSILQGDRSLSAGELAASTIGWAREAMSGSYDDVEQAAQTAFNSAKASQNIDQLVEVAHRFPNSTVVGQAYSAAGEQAQFAGDHRRAVQLLRLAFQSASETNDRLQLLQRMAQSYVQLPNGLATAAGRLRQASRLSPSAKLNGPLTLPNGRSIDDLSFAAAAKQITGDAGGRATPLPDCAIPPSVRPSGGSRKRPQPFNLVPLPKLDGAATSLLDSADKAARNDRLLAKTTDGVLVLRPGDTEPLFRVSGLPRVTQSAWAGTGLALIEPKNLSLLNGDSGKIRWQKSLNELTPQPRLVVAAVASNDATTDDRELNPGMQAGFGNGIAMMRARRLATFNDDGNDSAEIFSSLATLADRIICATNRGRVFAFDLSEGKLLWQRQVSDRPIVRLLASDDFIIVQSRDVGSTPFVLDTLDGEVLHGNEPSLQGTDLRVLSTALSPDGMLVMTGPQMLSMKDLFDPGSLAQATFQFPPKVISVMFYNPIDPANVQIQGQRVYALTDGGMKVRVVSLEDGKAVMFNKAQSIDTGASAGTALQMAADEGHCYVASERWIHGYDLTHGTNWGDGINKPQIRDIALSQSHVIALANQPGRDETDNSGQAELQLFSRLGDEHGAESGLFEYRFVLPKGFVVAEWQVVDGGVYVLGTDRKLLWLAGTASR